MGLGKADPDLRHDTQSSPLQSPTKAFDSHLTLAFNIIWSYRQTQAETEA